MRRDAFLPPKDFLGSPGMERAWSLDDSLAYTRWLATRHYENFHVVSFLLPKRLHQDFYNVYAFCRWADDLGDEIGDTQESLRLLAWWRGELECMSAGRVKHPVFVALAGTARQYQLPEILFDDLIKAFEQDQTVTRYQTFEDLFQYCRYSANPVGRLVLALCGYRDAERQALSDATCTALQLANFWQDVSVDYAKGRIYLPLEDMQHYKVSERDIAATQNTASFCEMMRFEVERAREWFRRGLPLVKKVDRELAIDIELFSRGGQEILNAIERQGFAVLGRRPSISKARKLALVMRAALGRLL